MFKYLTNPARSLKPDLVTAYKALSAAYEAEVSRNLGLAHTVQSQQRMIDQLQQRAIGTVRDMSRIDSMRDLLAEQQRLAAAGVPCVVQSGVIKHQFTRAILYPRPATS